jgi:hypothetical protein
MEDTKSVWEKVLEFLTTGSTPWIIALIAGGVGALWAFYRFRYEKKLEKFKEAYTELFLDDKQKKLSAIATLGVFKRDPMFEKHTIDVLISKLYMETDYDITNAIGNALIQYSNRRELIYIAGEILDINRNFFIQQYPYKQMAGDLERSLERLKKIRSGEFDLVKNPETEPARKENESKKAKIKEFDYKSLEKIVLQETEETIIRDFKKINIKNRYELTWGSQITADTFGRILRRAAAMRLSWSSVFWGYLKRGLIHWDFHFYSNRFHIHLFQNLFAYSQLAEFETRKTDIIRSSLEYATMADLHLRNVDINDSALTGAKIHACSFRKGRIHQSLFVRTQIHNTTFRDIHFTDIFFADVYFQNCSFINCTGLLPTSFCVSSMDQTTLDTLPKSIRDGQKNPDIFNQLINDVNKSGLRDEDVRVIIQAANEFENRLAKKEK